MKEGTDYLFFGKTHFNGLLYNGNISKAVMICTPSYVFFVDYENFVILNNWGVSKGVDEIRWKFNPADEIFADYTNIVDLENYFKQSLSEDNVFEINALDKFNVQAGFMFFGGISFKKKDKMKLTIALQPKASRVKVKNFYGL